MFSEKDYIMVCHGCGKFHIVRSMFISTPCAIQFKVEGSCYIVPNYACPECNHEPSVIGPDNRYVGRIRDAFLFGMSAESRERANREFYEAWRAKIDATKI